MTSAAIPFPNPLGIFFPSLCVLCTSPVDSGKVVCPTCRGNLVPSDLGQWLDGAAVTGGLDGIWSAFWFDETMQRLVHLLKYEGHSRLGQYLAELMFCQFEKEIPWSRFDGLVTLPLHRIKRRERGYNQSSMLTHALAKLSGLPELKQSVVRHRWTRSQTGLSIQERQQNVADCFRATAAGADRKVLLVDDVLTTGATASACARVLKAAGFGEVAAITVATPLVEN